jgi:hypothetical protein
MIKLPIDPYWENAITWFSEHKHGGIRDFHRWMAEQGVVGLPRNDFTPYLEFINPYQALIFRMKWYGSHN